ncbi:hypothetical protein WICPIJ_004387 [Wickerhamomyces pijperi]|uniref:Uncharacterized protein n=1 Tax=Wickerhamomyces pijperi TaxID=599730 RepID=A0A9P8TMT3_WICPI|nr:hypothetical protein WICPIJ_004387 [Wickerhamomyces pijperi]
MQKYYPILFSFGSEYRYIIDNKSLQGVHHFQHHVNGLQNLNNENSPALHFNALTNNQYRRHIEAEEAEPDDEEGPNIHFWEGNDGIASMSFASELVREMVWNDMIFDDLVRNKFRLEVPISSFVAQYPQAEKGGVSIEKRLLDLRKFLPLYMKAVSVPGLHGDNIQDLKVLVDSLTTKRPDSVNDELYNVVMDDMKSFLSSGQLEMDTYLVAIEVINQDLDNITNFPRLVRNLRSGISDAYLAWSIKRYGSK